jgi:hypothetical protein
MKRLLVLLFFCVLSVSLLAEPTPWAGGPVIQNPRVIAIYWGTPDAGFRASMDRFYDQLLRSSYLASLSEYGTGEVRRVFPDTAFRQWFGFPSSQAIGAGRFAGSYIIRPNTSGTLSTTDIGPTIDHEIHVGRLPAPDRNTIYMVHFSRAWQLYLGTNILGIPVGAKAGEGFCGYHAAYYSHYTSRAMVFAALPNQADLTATCASGPAVFDAETHVASHELVEAITDPGSAVIEGAFLSVGVSSVDQAWRLPRGTLGLDPFELADRCRWIQERLRTSADSRDNYRVNLIWRNSISGCVVSGPIGTLDSIRRDGSGALKAYGWSLDPRYPSREIPVHLYFDGPYPYGRGVATTARLARPDVNTGTGYPGNHGFEVTIPADLLDGSTHTVYAYGIGVTPGNNAFLGRVPLTFDSARPDTTDLPVMIASAKAPNQCLDVTGYSRTPGAAVQSYTCHGGENQRFRYHPGTQALSVYGDASLCLDAASGAGRNGDRLIIWPCNGDANQRWRFNLNNGEIRGINDKCVDGVNASVDNGTAVQVWSCNRGLHQSWFRK